MLVNGDTGDDFNAEFWFANTGVGWCGACSGLGMLAGTLLSEAGNGAHIAVPKGAKDAGVSGSSFSSTRSLGRRLGV